MHQAPNFSAFRARVIEPATRAIDVRPANASVHVVLMGSHAQSRLKGPCVSAPAPRGGGRPHAALRAGPTPRHWHFLDHWNLTANAPLQRRRAHAQQASSYGRHSPLCI